MNIRQFNALTNFAICRGEVKLEIANVFNERDALLVRLDELRSEVEMLQAVITTPEVYAGVIEERFEVERRILINNIEEVTAQRDNYKKLTQDLQKESQRRGKADM